MATNRAAQELQALNDMQGQVVDAKEALTKLQRDRAPMPSAPPSGEAGLALPEGLATGVGAALVFGPAAGVALGVAQAFLGKQAKQSALDQLAHEQNVLSESRDVFLGEVDRAYEAAATDEERAILSGIQTTYDAGMRLAVSSSDRLQQAGEQMLVKAAGDLNRYQETNDAQKIASDTLNAQIERELGQEQYERFQTTKTDFDSQSQVYLDTRKAVGIAYDALENGSPSDLYAAVILVNKALDPAGVVRGEDQQNVAALGSLQQRLTSAIEKLKTGVALDPDLRQDLVNTLGTIDSTNNQFQLALEAEYSDRINDIGLPAKYHDQFRKTEGVPAAEPPRIEGALQPRDPVMDRYPLAYNEPAKSEPPARDAPWQPSQPGLFQEGGFFDRRRKEKERRTNYSE